MNQEACYTSINGVVSQYIELENNLNKRNIEFQFCESRQAVIETIDLLTKDYQTIGIGNSQTLKSMNISEHLVKNEKTVYDKTYAREKTEIRKLKKLALTSECYITSTNAISLSGEIVNVDHSGNRVAAMTYGPDKVIIVATTNKIVENEKAAVARALTVATPLNARRAKIESPCSKGNPCTECSQDVRVCNYISIIRGQHEKNRMIVLLIDEALGF